MLRGGGIEGDLKLLADAGLADRSLLSNRRCERERGGAVNTVSLKDHNDTPPAK